MKYKMIFSILTSLSFLWIASAASESSEKTSDQNTRHFSFPGLVYGFVWDDIDGDGKLDFRERGLEDVVVYIDANDNGIREEHEISTTTNHGGFYLFTRLPQGDYVIRQETPFGWRNVSGGEGVDVTSSAPVQNSGTITPYIIGGAETEPNEYPFMVALVDVFGESFFQFCGGVLITDRWVATASHCSTSVDLSEVAILVGTNNVEDGSGQIVKIKDIHLHPQYVLSPPNPGDPFSVEAGYDIALWELEAPVLLGQNGLETVSMLSPENQDLAAEQILATAVGWGANDIDSRLLQDVHLPISNVEECAAAYPFSINFETQICGAAPEGGIDACQGDSGGPLLVRDFNTEQWKLAGITSYGNGCALQGFPGVWARVSVLSDWAKQTAAEPSRVHRLTVAPGSIVQRASFGNQTTRYEPSREIEPRWQLVNSIVTNDPEFGVLFDWRIIDEAPWSRTFDCETDVDGPGLINSIFVPCFEGVNQTSFPPLEDGVYVPSIKAQLDDTEFSRISDGFVVGTPAQVSVEGELEMEDSVDPDFPFGEYYIDYFDITEISDEKPVLIRVESDDLDLFVGLYDGDQRKTNGGGGTLEFFFSETIGGAAEYVLFPDANVNYLVGVSSFGTEEVGSYTITLVNQGTPVATTIELPSEARIQRTFRRQQTSRLVIPDSSLK